MVFRQEYDDVPAAPREAGLDPHWRGSVPAAAGALPEAYLPPAMSGAQPPWRRAAAWVLITMLTTATAGGVCLTYGPAELFRLLGH